MRNETLNKKEVSELFRSVSGTGGFQGLIRKLQSQCDQPKGIIELDDDDLRRIPEYAFDAGQGGFQNRLIKIFGRVLGPKLGR